MMRENNETIRKKMFSFYEKMDRDRVKRSKEESEFSFLELSDPLGEYKQIEKLDMEEQKIYENKLQNRDQRADDDDKTVVSQQPSATNNDPKKKKAVFDDVGKIH